MRDEDGNPLIINFYYHRLPNVQYLFVRLFEDENGYIDLNIIWMIPTMKLKNQCSD